MEEEYQVYHYPSRQGNAAHRNLGRIGTGLRNDESSCSDGPAEHNCQAPYHCSAHSNSPRLPCSALCRHHHHLLLVRHENAAEWAMMDLADYTAYSAMVELVEEAAQEKAMSACQLDPPASSGLCRPRRRGSGRRRSAAGRAGDISLSPGRRSGASCSSSRSR